MKRHCASCGGECDRRATLCKACHYAKVTKDKPTRGPLLCGCGCGAEICLTVHGRKYVDPSHRARAWQNKNREAYKKLHASAQGAYRERKGIQAPLSVVSAGERLTKKIHEIVITEWKRCDSVRRVALEARNQDIDWRSV